MSIPDRTSSDTHVAWYCVLGFLIGAIIGGPVSYWLQPGELRFAMSLADYFEDLWAASHGGVEGGARLLQTAEMSVLACGAIGLAIGIYLFYRHSAHARASKT